MQSSAHKARVELKRLINQFNVTLVYVTHDQVEAMSIGDRIVVLDAGRIIQQGTYEQLHDDPDNLFIAEFIGTPTINTFWGRIEDGMWDGSYMGRATVPQSVPDGTEVIVAIRPKHILLTDNTGIPSVIDRITPFFAEKYQLLDVWLRKRRWQIQVPLDTEFEVGETVHCMLDWSHAYFFNAESGERIR